ncbi:MAG: helix-turn-helix transcriptional regulator [Nitrospira sp. CG24D]|nr:MAG: helix-turn-helix transcriptional regulator [Nitrospira sp. CG24D]
MTIALFIKNRLKELRLGQKDLARAANVTDSYISQLMANKKLPPAPNRTDMYDKISRVLKLPDGHLAKLADLQRREHLKKQLGDQPGPLLRDVRELILRKCNTAKNGEIRVIFEKQPFGELERFVTQKLLSVAKGVARQELDNQVWMRQVARISKKTYPQMRVTVLQFLDTTIFDLSNDNCIAFLDPLIESWDIDLATFCIEIVLNRRIAPGYQKRFEFIEKGPASSTEEEPGLTEFLKDASLSGEATEEEIAFLRALQFGARRPTAFYYYRELQSLRDPLHFRAPDRSRSR